MGRQLMHKHLLRSHDQTSRLYFPSLDIDIRSPLCSNLQPLNGRSIINTAAERPFIRIPVPLVPTFSRRGAYSIAKEAR